MAESDLVPMLHRTAPAIPDFDSSGFAMRGEPALGIAKMRTFAPPTVARFKTVVGIAPPAALRQTDGASLSVAWMAPTEWLITGPDAVVAAWIARTAMLGADDLLVVDFTHARAAFQISGPDARTRLAAHCPLDLWDGVFPEGKAARSLLGDAGMFITRLADVAGSPCFRIIVDQTMAGYATRLFARD